MNRGSKKHKEALNEACQELEKQGYKTVKIERIPDAIAFKGEILFIEAIRKQSKSRAKREYEAAYGKDVPLYFYLFSKHEEKRVRFCDYYPHHKWTKQEEEFLLKKREEGWSYKRIAQSLGLRKRPVVARYYELRRKTSPNTIITDITKHGKAMLQHERK